MKVRDRMISPVITVEPSMPIKEALRIMTEKGIRRLPVIEGEHLVGIIAFHDIDKAMRSPGVIPVTPVEWIMTKNPVSAEADDELVEAVRKLRKYKISCLPIHEDGKVVGVLSVSDALEILAELLEKEE